LGSSDATGWTLRVGGLAALGAAWLSRGLFWEHLKSLSPERIIQIYRAHRYKDV
jgi:hypothetical protein